MHNRGDFDLTQHQQFSGKKLEYFDQPNNRRYTPYVVETSVGADRTTLAVLVNAYHEETVEGEDEGRTVLELQPSLAPVKAGIFPLVKKDGMREMAHASRTICGSSSRVLRRVRRDRASLPAPGRDRHAVRHHGRWRVDRGRDGDDSRPRHAAAGACLGGSAPRRARRSDWPNDDLARHAAPRGGRFHQAISRELYPTGAGLKKSAELQAIYARFANVFSDERWTWCASCFATRPRGAKSSALRASSSSGRPTRACRASSRRSTSARSRGSRARSHAWTTAAEFSTSRSRSRSRTPRIATSDCASSARARRSSRRSSRQCAGSASSARRTSSKRSRSRGATTPPSTR